MQVKWFDTGDPNATTFWPAMKSDNSKAVSAKDCILFDGMPWHV